MTSWEVQFSGNGNSLSVENFLNRIRVLALQNKGGDVHLVVENIHLLPKQTAHDWKWRFRGRHHSLSWLTFSDAVSLVFQDVHFNLDTQGLMRS